ncbi:hypothetical protein MUK42_29722 [Musa troglodytarum]|uniref:Uncharacterized protein n=1 Tax=Musa troglodytarum TaxID=320322 RepID=A0A9E7JNF7_9LILI|nr:hypothetical protein MUK42_29722 [Musa troglodytarum]
MTLQGLEVGDGVALHVCGDAAWEIRCGPLQNADAAVLAAAQNVPSRLEVSEFFSYSKLLEQLNKRGACFKEKPSEAAAAALPQDVVSADQKAAMEEFVAYHNDEAVSGGESSQVDAEAAKISSANNTWRLMVLQLMYQPYNAQVSIV